MRHPHLTPALVAIAHGSRDPRAGATIAELLAAARTRAAVRGLAGLDVRGAFLGHAPPAPLQVLTALAGDGDGERDAVVLPLLLTAAYHSSTDIPGVLAEATAGLPGLRIGYGEPLGPHPGLVRALERRLAEAGRDPGGDPSRTAVVLASAGSSQPTANAAIAAMASGWQADRGWLAVRPAFASAASPTPAEAVADLLRRGAGRVVVASYLLAPGLFADRIRESSLAAGAVAVSAPLGAAPEVADVLLDRYQQAAAGGLGHQAAGQWRDSRVSAR
ncbi:MAG TPA: sirohydrochlorin chelatase [Streptosporangiaceae bacterium]|jgi:sirohydrochlorin ferrochelatase|nr:sirohydrochlorin chelatase [Streptosporangiaceae bacterium]